MRHFLIICFVFLVSVAAPANAQFSFLGIKNSLVDFVLDQISVPGELVVTAEGVEDGEEGSTDIVGLKVADSEGVWLSVERIAVRWDSSRILRGELEINQLSATGVNVLRPPTAAAADVAVKEGADIAAVDDDPFDWPRAPITVRVDDLTLTNVSVAPGVIATEGAIFDAKGALKDEGDEQSLDLAITRTDAVAGQIVLQYLRDFSDANRLDLTLNADEAAGGLVAALADLPETSATKVALRGVGPLSDWALNFDANVDDVFAADGEAIVKADGALAVTADFTLTPGTTLDPAIVRALSPAARLQVDIAEGEDGVVRINQGALTARDLSLVAKGTFDKINAIADLDIDLEARSGLSELAEGVDFQGFGFQGAVKGPLDDLNADGRIFLNDLRTAAADIGAADLNAKLHIKGEVITLDIGGGAQRLRLDRLTPELLGNAEIAIKGEYAGDKATLETLRFAATPLTLSASGQVTLGEAPAATLSYELATPQLAPLAKAYEVDAAGRLRAEGQANGPLDALSITGALAAEALTYQDEPYGRVDLAHDILVDETPGGTAAITADGSRFGEVTFDGGFEMEEQVLRLTDMIATGLGARIAGALTVDLEKTLIDGEIDLAVPDLTPMSALTGDPVAGAVNGRVLLSSASGTQGVTANLDVVGFEGFDAILTRADVDATVTDALGAANAKLNVDAAGASGAGAQIGALTITGDVTGAATDAPFFDLAIKASNAGAAGAKAGSVRATAKGSLADLTANATVSNISASGVLVADVTAQARVKNAASGDPTIDARVVAGGADLGVMTLPEIVATARGRLSALDLAIDTAGALEDGRELALAVKARADLAGDGPQATVSTLTATLEEDEFALREPLVIRSRGGTTNFKAIDLTFPGGEITGAATLYGNGVAGDLQLTADNLRPLSALAGAPLDQGALTLSAVFDTRRGRAKADVALSGSDLRFSDVVADIGGLGVEATVAWDGKRAQVDASLSGPFEQPFRAAISAPLRASSGVVPVVPSNERLSGSIDWLGDIGEVWALVPAPGHVLDGETRIALTLGGTVAKPTVGGDVAIIDGRYENLDVGAILTELAVASQIAPDGAFVVDVKANDGADNPVAARVELADGTLDARVQATGATLVRRDDATASITLDITAKGPLAAPAIKGTVNIDRAEIRLVNATPPGVADLGEVRIKGEERPVEEEAAGGDIALEVDITGPQDIFVRGRGLDSEWAIDLKVRGTAAAPQITGDIQKRRGVLSFLGNDFDLERGAIRFTGARGINPLIDVQLLHENDGITGGIAVSGTANAPEINFISRPALPEEEVLPRVLFGRSKQSLSPLEALNLATGVATLLDGSGGAIDDVRAAVGVDVLRIEDGEDGPSITVGKNVADGVFVGAKQPVGGGSATVTVEIEVFDNVTIDSEVGQEAGTSIGLNWKKDF